jgi:MFS family permease
VDADDTITVDQRESIGFGPTARAMFRMYPKRTVLGILLMSCQTFMYNAIFFTYALILSNFFGVPEGGRRLLYFRPRHREPARTAHARTPLRSGGSEADDRRLLRTAGVLIAVIGYLFVQGFITSAITQTALFGGMFFFALAGASVSYLTGSEIFPMKLRVMALGLFYAISMTVGGIAGPAIYGRIIDTGDPWILFIGYRCVGVLLIVAALTELGLGVDAGQQSLEDVAAPLTAIQ